MRVHYYDSEAFLHLVTLFVIGIKRQAAGLCPQHDKSIPILRYAAPHLGMMMFSQPFGCQPLGNGPTKSRAAPHTNTLGRRQ